MFRLRQHTPTTTTYARFDDIKVASSSSGVD
jgi:hypothetical protein